MREGGNYSLLHYLLSKKQPATDITDTKGSIVMMSYSQQVAGKNNEGQFGLAASCRSHVGGDKK